MFHHRNLEPRYQVEVLMTATYLKARSPHKTIKKTKPEELWNWRKPIMKHLKVFYVMPTFTNLVRPKQNQIQRTKYASLWAETRTPKHIN